jgi:lysozyme family protein
MSTAETIITGVIEREGGYVFDPADPGGETKYGIARRYHPDVNIRDLTREEAARIYYYDYWKPSRAEALPEHLRETYFDMVVNLGPKTAVRVLQRACRGQGADIVVDGRLGPRTLGACRRLEADRLRAYRLLYYARKVIKSPGKERFYYGWYQRAVTV